jgi:hypothetical protein
MGRVRVFVNFVVLLVKILVVGVLLGIVVVRDRVVSELSHNYEDKNEENSQTPENTD